ncbi:MAG: MFS transporter [Thermomicrobiales bacterium]
MTALAAQLARSPRPLRRPAFARLLAGYTLAGLGHQFTMIALLWFVLALTDSGSALGLVVICMQLPGVISSPAFGRLLDRVQPRTILVIDNLLRALFVAMMPVLYWMGHLTMPAILVLSVLAGLLAPATVIGIQVLLPDLVPDEELDGANALISFALNFPFFIGPAMAGLLITIWSGPVVMLIDAAAFLLMAAVCRALPDITRVREVPAASQEGLRSPWWTFGFGTLLQFPSVLMITLLSFVFYFSYGPLEPALPIYARDVLHTGSAGYGLLWSGMGAGIILGLATIPFAARVRSQGMVFATVALLWGGFQLGLAFTDRLWAAVLLLGLCGAAWGPYSTMKNTLIQRLIPPHMRGEVFGAQYMILVVGTPLGALIGGFLLDAFTATQVIAISSIACIVAGIGGLFSPALRTVTRESRYSDPASIPLTGGGVAPEEAMP